MNCAASIEKGTARSETTYMQINVYLFNVQLMLKFKFKRIDHPNDNSYPKILSENGLLRIL